MSDVTKITLNGREYDDIEQMPPEMREEYLQALAALREADVGSAPGVVKNNGVSRSVVQESFVYNGREYHSRDELPPEARTLLDQLPGTPVTDKTTEIEIKTIKTFSPRVSRIGKLADGLEEPPENTPTVAWLLVKILVVVVLILLFLLYLAGGRFKG